MQITDYTRGGKCPEGCNMCCSNTLAVSKEEIEKIRKYLRTHDVEIKNRNSVLGGYVDKCPFVKDDGRCGIYEVRPEICRYFFCKRELESGQFNHEGKSIINMLETFKPGSFMGEGAPDINRLNMIYQIKKR